MWSWCILVSSSTKWKRMMLFFAGCCYEPVEMPLVRGFKAAGTLNKIFKGLKQGSMRENENTSNPLFFRSMAWAALMGSKLCIWHLTSKILSWTSANTFFYRSSYQAGFLKWRRVSHDFVQLHIGDPPEVPLSPFLQAVEVPLDAAHPSGDSNDSSCYIHTVCTPLVHRGRCPVLDSCHVGSSPRVGYEGCQGCNLKLKMPAKNVKPGPRATAGQLTPVHSPASCGASCSPHSLQNERNSFASRWMAKCYWMRLVHV